MKNMLQLAEKENIQVNFFDFAEPIKGLYFREPFLPPIIGLNISLQENISQLRSVMGEELGHHFTTIGLNIPASFYHYSDRLEINKAEYLALVWAANYLINDDDLKEAIKGGITELNYLAYHFNVTEEIVKIKFNIFTSKLITQNQLFLYHRE